MLIGFIGTGNMGGAVARAAAKGEYPLLLANRTREKAETLARELGARVSVADNAEVIGSCDMVFLGVKPTMIADLASSLGEALSTRTRPLCLVSMLAAVSLADLRGYFPEEYVSLIRMMPNTPVSVGQGMIQYCTDERVTPSQKAIFLDVLSHAGMSAEIEEKYVDAASAVSGCGPAFACMFIEALADGGVRCGLRREDARKWAAQMMRGTAEMILSTGDHPGALKDAVCSPGGTTIAGVAALEAGGMRSAVIEAVTAAYRRTRLLLGEEPGV